MRGGLERQPAAVGKTHRNQPPGRTLETRLRRPGANHQDVILPAEVDAIVMDDREAGHRLDLGGDGGSRDRVAGPRLDRAARRDLAGIGMVAGRDLLGEREGHVDRGPQAARQRDFEPARRMGQVPAEPGAAHRHAAGVCGAGQTGQQQAFAGRDHEPTANLWMVGRTCGGARRPGDHQVVFIGQRGQQPRTAPQHHLLFTRERLGEGRDVRIRRQVEDGDHAWKAVVAGLCFAELHLVADEAA